MVNEKVMICGGLGFLGSAVVKELLTQNYDVINIGENVDKHKDILSGIYIPHIECDITDQKGIGSIIASESPNIFINCCVRALGYSFTEPMYIHDSIIRGLINILEAIRYMPKKIRFIQISSSEVYGTATQFPTNETHPMRPATLYAACKAAADMITLSYHRCYGMETVIVRPFNQVGINAPIHKNASVITKTFIRLLAGKNPIIMGNGFQTRDFMDTRDTAKGIVAAMNCEELIGHVVCLGSGKEVSIDKLVNLCANIYVNHHLHEPFKDFVIAKHIDTRLGDNTRMRADISRAKQYLNWEPKISLYDSLHETYHWLEEKIKTNPEIIKLIEEQ